MKTTDIISWEVTQFTNEYGDEIEMDIIHYSEECQVTVNIYDEKPSFRDITSTATHPSSKRKAAKQAWLNYTNEPIQNYSKTDAIIIKISLVPNQTR